MNFSKHILVVLFLGFFAVNANSQQLNLSQNSHFNLFNENAAFAGNYSATHLAAEYYRLWNIDGAPTSFSFAAHTPILNNKTGVGLKAQRTSIGAHEEVSFKAAFSYKIPIRSGRIAFGIGAGFVQYNFDRNKLDPLDPNDTYLGLSGLNSTILDFDFSLLYTDNKNYLGLEINQITQSEWNLNDADKSNQVPHFKFIAGHVFVLENNDFIRGAVHVRSDVNFMVQSDISLSYFYQNKIWIGTTYRTDYGMLAHLEINFTKRFQAGYVAGIPLSSEVTSFSPSHSVILGYMLPSNKTKAPSARRF